VPLRDPGRARTLLAAWLAASFALSAVSDARVLGAAWAVSLALLARGAGKSLRRAAIAVLPLTLGGSLAAAVVDLWRGDSPRWEPLLSLNLRAFLLAFLALSVLARVSLLRALEPWPLATRVLVVALAQIHALRMLVTDSLLGLRSRLPRRPRTREVIRGAAGVTATLLVLSGRNARDVGDALRARGF
jgi:cobalt/nickel transport system permease protein